MFIPALKSETPSLTQQKSDPDAVQTPKPKSYRFYVKRSKSNNLPVYHETRAHGSNVVTSIRKISGDVDDLKSLLQKELKLDNKHIVVNSLTKAIKIKGHRREEIIAYLESLGL